MAFIYILDSVIQASVSRIVGKLQGELLKILHSELKKIFLDFKNIPCEKLQSSGKGAQIKRSLNGIEKRIQQIELRINQIRGIIGTLQKPVQALNTLVEVLSALPIPQSVPPGEGMPISTTLTFSRLIQTLRELIRQIEQVCSSILQVLSQFDKIKAKVNTEIERVNLIILLCEAERTLQEARIKCKITVETLVELELFNPDGSSKLLDYRKKVLEGKEIKEELTWFLKTLELVPCMKKQLKVNLSGTGISSVGSSGTEIFISRSGKKYLLKVLVDREDSEIAVRHYAVALDSIGIVVLQGQRSYSSNLEILIDELKFALDQLQ